MATTTTKAADKKAAEVKTEVKAAAEKVEATAKKTEAKKAPAAKKAAPAKKATADKKAETAKKAETTAKKAAPAKKACAKKAAPKASAKKECCCKAVEATFDSIFKAVECKAKKAKFTGDFMATQITLKGNLDCQPLYVKVEDKKAEVAPFEYNNACFYIDADAETFAAILNGKKCIYEALANGSVSINGDATKAILFVKALFC